MMDDKLKCTQTDDAWVWAEEFMQTVEKNKLTINDEFMFSWFANAIECSHVVRSRKDLAQAGCIHLNTEKVSKGLKAGNYLLTVTKEKGVQIEEWNGYSPTPYIDTENRSKRDHRRQCSVQESKALEALNRISASVKNNIGRWVRDDILKDIETIRAALKMEG